MMNFTLLQASAPGSGAGANSIILLLSLLLLIFLIVKTFLSQGIKNGLLLIGLWIVSALSINILSTFDTDVAAVFSIVILVSVLVFSIWFATRANKKVRMFCKGRTKEQSEVIRYFCITGRFAQIMSDQEYNKLVRSYVNRDLIKQKALNKIDLDESELGEIEPVCFDGFLFDKSKISFYKKNRNKDPRSSAYQISWLFFSSTQVYLYQYTFHLDKDDKNEILAEYSYNDITSFSTSYETVETQVWNRRRFETESVNTNRFAITVPGDKVYCSMKQNDDYERAVHGMKTKLREKKNQ